MAQQHNMWQRWSRARKGWAIAAIVVLAVGIAGFIIGRSMWLGGADRAATTAVAFPASSEAFVGGSLNPSLQQKYNFNTYLEAYPAYRDFKSTYASSALDSLDTRKPIVQQIMDAAGCSLNHDRDFDGWLGEGLGAAAGPLSQGKWVFAVAGSESTQGLATMRTASKCLSQKLIGTDLELGVAYGNGYYYVAPTQAMAATFAAQTPNERLTSDATYTAAMQAGNPNALIAGWVRAAYSQTLLQQVRDLPAGGLLAAALETPLQPLLKASDDKTNSMFIGAEIVADALTVSGQITGGTSASAPQPLDLNVAKTSAAIVASTPDNTPTTIVAGASVYNPIGWVLRRGAVDIGARTTGSEAHLKTQLEPVQALGLSDMSYTTKANITGGALNEDFAATLAAGVAPEDRISSLPQFMAAVPEAARATTVVFVNFAPRGTPVAETVGSLLNRVGVPEETSEFAVKNLAAVGAIGLSSYDNNGAPHISLRVTTLPRPQ